MSRFLVRLDDICETMDWSRFRLMRDFLQRLDVRPVIGIVPDNRDPRLSVEPPRADFWDEMRQLRDAGWTVAQHGYQHLYHTDDPGLLGIGRKSEFAGLPHDRQEEMLASGRRILEEEGLETDVFMAPSHTFDANTLAALRALGFRYLTDGFGLFPYEREGLTLVPQLFRSGLHLPVGVYTLCLHLNKIPPSRLGRIQEFIEAKHRSFVDFEEAVRTPRPPEPIPSALRGVTRVALTTARWAGRRLKAPGASP